MIYGYRLARFSPKTYTLIFISCDFISLVLQGSGGGLAATAGDQSTGQTGINLMIAGLAFQVASMTVFMVLAIDYMISVRRAMNRPSRPSELTGSFSEMRSKRMFSLFPWGKLCSCIPYFPTLAGGLPCTFQWLTRPPLYSCCTSNRNNLHPLLLSGCRVERWVRRESRQ